MSGPSIQEKRRLGGTGLSVTSVCVGTSPLASVPRLYGYEVDDEQARRALDAFFDGPFTFLDTSNNYGDGLAERRIGEALAARGGTPDGFVIATKVDADKAGIFDAQRVRDSASESMSRLGLDRLPLVYLHDPEKHITFEQAMAKGGAVEGLLGLRDEGLVGSIGIAGGPVDEMSKYVRSGVFEVLLTHNRFTLLDRSAGPLIEECTARGIAVVNAAPYGGGLLARGPDAHPKYAYGLGSDAAVLAAREMEAVCAAAGVPLAAAALQFSLREPAIESTVVGVSRAERIAETERLANWPIPDGLWDELDALCPPAEYWIG